MSKNNSKGEIYIDTESKYDLAVILSSPQSQQHAKIANAFSSIFDLEFIKLTPIDVGSTVANDDGVKDSYKLSFGLKNAPEDDSVRLKRERVNSFFQILHSLQCSGIDVTDEKMKEMYEKNYGRLTAAQSATAVRFNISSKKDSKAYTERYLTEAQEIHDNAIRDNRVTITNGEWGTGKTYIACRAAAEHLRDNKVKKIYIVRSPAGAGNDLGALPGTLEEKLQEWLAPIYAELSKAMTKGGQDFTKIKNSGAIEGVSVQHIGGKNFDDAFIIFDEAQNSDMSEITMIMSRLGKNSKMAVLGDKKRQAHISKSGFSFMVEWMGRKQKPGMLAVTHYTKDDIIRNDFLKLLSEMLDDYSESKESKPKAHPRQNTRNMP